MKKIGFGLAMLLGGCVSDTAATGAGGLTPVSAMPKGTATYVGQISSKETYNDNVDSGVATTNYEETTTADFSLTANFDTATTTAVASNARIENSYYREVIGVSGPTFYQDTGRYSGEATGIGVIGTDQDGIYFTNNLKGTLTMTSATSNGVAVTPSDYWFTSRSVDQTVSGYFTGSGATGIFGQDSGTTGSTAPNTLTSWFDTVTGTKR